MNSDTQLQSDVMAELKWQPSLDAAHIGVSARANVVTLTGQVGHYAEKSVAEKIAKGVYGVQAVANDIVVELLTGSQHTDADIAQAALSALKWDFEVPTHNVTVIVKSGVVTLEGTVDWQYQKEAARRCVQYLMGVRGVNNLISIKPTVKWAEVKSEIEDAFRRNAELDARRIGIATRDATVTLSGSVSSFAERDEAVMAAWSAPGVMAVYDNLAVSL